jgi:hypothetical protein
MGIKHRADSGFRKFSALNKVRFDRTDTCFEMPYVSYPRRWQQAKKMTMKFKFQILLIFLFLSGGLHACECILTKSMEEMVEDADIIFYGTVVGVDDRDDPVYSEQVKYYTFGDDYANVGGYEPIFEIIESFKGELKNHLVGGKFNYLTEWTNCDRLYKIGYSYIFFGNYDEKGIIRTNICMMGGIVKDLATLEEIRVLTKKQ